VIGLFLNYPVGALLNACDKQTINTINMGITMILNIVLNLILIPQYQHLGAATAALISLSVLFILNLSWVSKIIKYNYKYLIIKTIQALISALIMAIIIYLTQPYLNFILLIILGAIIYIILMYLSRGFTKSDIKYLWQAIIKKQI
jgi:O-antigen/teichoic acid export membrane protein